MDIIVWYSFKKKKILITGSNLGFWEIAHLPYP